MRDQLKTRNKSKGKRIKVRDTDQSDIADFDVLVDIDDDRDPLEDLEYVHYARSFS